MIHNESFVPFFGVVEDNNDPDQLGRVQVRCYGFHPRNKGQIPTEGLPWMTCLVSNSSGVSGIGHTPYYAKGSTVFGYFIGKDLQTGLVMGSVAGAPGEAPDPKLGFFDPDGALPNYEVGESDVNRLARDRDVHWMVRQKSENRVESDEPEAHNGSQYPHNKVFETEAGHIKEWDDTPGNERIHEWHKAGTYYEILPDGSRVLKVVGDDYEIVVGDRSVRVQGDVSVKVDGSATVDVEGATILRAPSIQLGEDDKVEPSVLGDKLASWINNELVPWLNAHNHIGNLGFPTSPAATGSVGPFEAGTAEPEGDVYSKVNTNQ